MSLFHTDKWLLIYILLLGSKVKEQIMSKKEREKREKEKLSAWCNM